MKLKTAILLGKRVGKINNHRNRKFSKLNVTFPKKKKSYSLMNLIRSCSITFYKGKMNSITSEHFLILLHIICLHIFQRMHLQWEKNFDSESAEKKCHEGSQEAEDDELDNYVKNINGEIIASEILIYWYFGEENIILCLMKSIPISLFSFYDVASFNWFFMLFLTLLL